MHKQMHKQKLTEIDDEGREGGREGGTQQRAIQIQGVYRTSSNGAYCSLSPWICDLSSVLELSRLSMGCPHYSSVSACSLDMVHDSRRTSLALSDAVCVPTPSVRRCSCRRTSAMLSSTCGSAPSCSTLKDTLPLSTTSPVQLHCLKVYSRY